MIHARDAAKHVILKKKKQYEIFDKVANICYSKIKRYVGLLHGSCEFEIPEFMFGYPLYDVDACLKYVIKSLSKNGYIIIVQQPKTLHIKWMDDDRDNLFQSHAAFANPYAKVQNLLEYKQQ